MGNFDAKRQKNALLQLAILTKREKPNLKFDAEKALDFLKRYNLDATGDSDVMLVSYDSVNLIPVVKWQALVKIS